MLALLAADVIEICNTCLCVYYSEDYTPETINNLNHSWIWDNDING